MTIGEALVLFRCGHSSRSLTNKYALSHVFDFASDVLCFTLAVNLNRAMKAIVKVEVSASRDFR